MSSYREAGVDLEGAERHTDSIAGPVQSTWTDEVVGAFGGFAAGIRIPYGYDDPVLMMTTDGVGTKLEIARRADRWEGVGFDLVAMCVDDLAAAGAAPLGFVDYMAVGSLQPERDRTIVESIAAACLQAGCALLGGETAEHPGVMDPDAVDLAGAVMGVVEAERALGPQLVKASDVVVGLSSPNLRSNGFSLVRSALGDAVVEHATTLLDPSVIYSPIVLEAIGTGAVHAAAHITGGGVAANLARALPDGISATVDTSTWPRPAVFDLIAEQGVPEEEMLRAFNVGIGFCLVIDAGAIDEVLEIARPHDPVVIGKLSVGDGVLLT